MKTFLALFCALAVHALAANHYIRAGAAGAGTGANWTDAWTTFGAVSWTRGDTYYVAGGTYAENVVVFKTGTGTYIFIKKANAADNSGDAGWNASYATDVALITGEFDPDNWISMDGVTGSGTTGHGIKIYRATQPVGNGRIYGVDATLSDHVIMKHVEVLGPGYNDDLGPEDDGLSRGVNFNLVPHGYLGFCWIHEWSENGMVMAAAQGTDYVTDPGMIVENNVFSETGGTTGTAHGQAIMIRNPSDFSAFLVYRNNVFRNTTGTAFLSFLTGSYSDVRIYNNLFYLTDLEAYNVISPSPIYGRDPDGVITGMEIYNNVFRGIGDASHTNANGQLAFDGTGSSGIVVKNNIWENCNFSSAPRGINTQANNGYYGNTGAGIPSGTTGQVNGAASTFTNAASADFTLVTGGYAIAAGVDLSSVFTTDITGATRSTWDLGAYKYTGSVSTPSTGGFGLRTGTSRLGRGGALRAIQ